MQLDQFKRASALASLSAKPELPIIPIMTKKASPTVPAKKLSPLALLAGAKQTNTNDASDVTAKKRAASDVEDGSPNAKKPKLEEKATDDTAKKGENGVAPKRGLVKYNRNDDE